MKNTIAILFLFTLLGCKEVKTREQPVDTENTQTEDYSDSAFQTNTNGNVTTGLMP